MQVKLGLTKFKDSNYMVKELRRAKLIILAQKRENLCRQMINDKRNLLKGLSFDKYIVGTARKICKEVIYNLCWYRNVVFLT